MSDWDLLRFIGNAFPVHDIGNILMCLVEVVSMPKVSDQTVPEPDTDPDEDNLPDVPSPDLDEEAEGSPSIKRKHFHFNRDG